MGRRTGKARVAVGRAPPHPGPLPHAMRPRGGEGGLLALRAGERDDLRRRAGGPDAPGRAAAPGGRWPRSPGGAAPYSRGGPLARAQPRRCVRNRSTVRKPRCTRRDTRAPYGDDRLARRTGRPRARAWRVRACRGPARFGARSTYGARSRVRGEHGRGGLTAGAAPGPERSAGDADGEGNWARRRRDLRTRPQGEGERERDRRVRAGPSCGRPSPRPFPQAMTPRGPRHPALSPAPWRGGEGGVQDALARPRVPPIRPRELDGSKGESTTPERGSA
ncbi:hypothetical protein AMOR_38220 [Anaeromyxobacter oryzae]|uniref:LigA n=1 Tax=Anaeromyxobacter oryzae TaxID=2918170 RepID=A0ABN6MV61_9BACT|nr:hypothetical protein AMOR_38220 [Anaeromyxobacter oryzae]